MNIFEDKVRVDLDVALHSETTYAYLDRSARPEMALVRDLLNDWFSRYPDQPGPHTDAGEELREALRSRLRSRRERQQTEAFWELYLHESFVRARCRVAVRADTPDFEVAFDGGRFYVEATVRGSSDEETGNDNRVQSLRDALNRAQVGEWILQVAVSVDSTRSAPFAALRRDLEAWVRTLDIDAIRSEYARDPRHAFENRPHASFERDGWTVSTSVIPKRKGVERQGRQPAIGIWGGAVVRINNAAGMRDSLTTKSAKVRRLDTDAPVVLALLVDRPFADGEDIESALLGADAATFLRGADGAVLDATATRASGGFWSRGGRDARAIAAVIGATRLNATTVTRAVPELWTNPLQRRVPFPIPASLPWVPCWVDDDGNLQRGDAPSPSAFFELSEGWPER